MKHTLLLSLLLVSPAVCAAKESFTVPKAAAEDKAPPAFALSESDKKDLARLEAYFNAMPTVTSKFAQRAERPNGKPEFHTGTLKLWRPGRILIKYDGRFGDFIVADGKTITFWDGEMQNQSQTKVEETLAGLILRKNFTFGRDVTVTRIYYPTPQQLQISLRGANDPAAGELTLTLSDHPFGLLGWQVKDGQGLTTDVKLTDIKTGEKFAAGDFVFRRPEPRPGSKQQ
jgi:outer membrane lipoprotein-sorting protein